MTGKHERSDGAEATDKGYEGGHRADGSGRGGANGEGWKVGGAHRSRGGENQHYDRSQSTEENR